ncbi:MAG: hypothetical protein MK078_10225 [Crocinitomicaceae bacterium]|nr:hypothetical protein [Crocinitomicaceae bacterium]
MRRKLGFLLTKLFIFIAIAAIQPNNVYAQDKGAKSVKSDKGGKKNKKVKNSYRSRKRSGKRHWSNQDKATRKRMKRAAKNAKRRQKGKSMKNNRLV